MEVDVQYLLLLDSLHVDNLSPVQDAEIHILTGGFRELFQEGQGCFPHIHAGQGGVTEGHDSGREGIEF